MSTHTMRLTARDIRWLREALVDAVAFERDAMEAHADQYALREGCWEPAEGCEEGYRIASAREAEFKRLLRRLQAKARRLGKEGSE